MPGAVEGAVGLVGMLVEGERPALRQVVVGGHEASIRADLRQPGAGEVNQSKGPTLTDLGQCSTREPRPTDTPFAELSAKCLNERPVGIYSEVQDTVRVVRRVEAVRAGSPKEKWLASNRVAADPGAVCFVERKWTLVQV